MRYAIGYTTHTAFGRPASVPLMEATVPPRTAPTSSKACSPKASPDSGPAAGSPSGLTARCSARPRSLGRSAMGDKAHSRPLRELPGRSSRSCRPQRRPPEHARDRGYGHEALTPSSRTSSARRKAGYYLVAHTAYPDGAARSTPNLPENTRQRLETGGIASGNGSKRPHRRLTRLCQRRRHHRRTASTAFPGPTCA